MTIPGICFTTAAAFMAAIGDIGRFPTPRQLVGYLGLDPTVRQSGSSPARTREHLQARLQGGPPLPRGSRLGCSRNAWTPESVR
jgi:transposase